MLDYDVVIIGGSVTGRDAAAIAATYHGRIALLEPCAPLFWQGYHQALLQGAEGLKQAKQRFSFGLYQGMESDVSKLTLDWNIAQQSASVGASRTSAQNSLENLARLGVDVISGAGEFVNQPDLALAVNGRILRSRYYLLAMGSKPKIPEIEGLALTGFLTVETLHKLSQIPQKLAIIGGDPSGVELAQFFAQLGSQVTIIVKSSHLLGKEDHQAAYLIQAHLEAEGVTVLTQTEVIQTQVIQGQKWIQAGNKALEVDEILVAAGRQPQFYDLNLSTVGVKFNPNYLSLNQQLQTTNPRIYGCGDLAGGYPFEHIAAYEAQIALKNIMLLPRFKVNYQGIPWAILTQPQLGRVGLTEQQAKRYYGDKISIHKQSFTHLSKAQLLGEISGFYQLICHRNGKILGAAIVSPQASEMIGIIALAIRQGLKIDTIAQLPQISSTLSEMHLKVAKAWQHSYSQKDSWKSDWIETLNQWRRFWS
jgi:pyruvate/2-oxoglutarate dehydrogenase complex dihydrolipoamide dehydrogenase (E3) component